LGLALLAASPAYAQFDAGAEFFRRQEERDALERERIAPRPEVVLPRPERALPEVAADETPCFRIDRIDVAGAEGRLAWVGEAAARYADRCLGVQGINAIVARLQDRLIADGLVTTRVVVPEQDLADGTLELVVIPGRIGDVRFAEPQAHASLANVLTMRRGDLLDLRDLEEALEQMRRLPSQDVEFDIVPGAAPGESDIVVKRTAGRPVRGIVSVDDSGQTVTGRYQFAATIAIDGPLGLNDLFFVSLNQALDRAGGTRDSSGANAYYSIPFGWWVFSFSAAEFDFKQTVQGATQDFVNTGESQTLDARVARTVHRSQFSRTGVQFRVQRRRTATWIDDVEILAQRRRISVAEVALQHRHRFGDVIVDGALAYRQGVPWFDAEAPLPDAGPDTPNPRYRMGTLDLLVAVPFEVAGMRWRYAGAVRAQYTNDALYAQDFFSIGNRFTVRGFDGQRTLASERGWLIRNELASPIAIPGHEVYAGLDYGEVGGPFAKALPGRSLTGAVVGLRGGFRGLLYEGFVGWGLRSPEGFSKTPNYGFQVMYSF
jgi:hemolysin activation/secretion protein